MDEMISKANVEEFVVKKGMVTGKKYSFYKHMYAVLDSDLNSPLSCVSVANNSLSIDLWTGCPFQCAYCHVQGISEDIASDGKMRKMAVRRNRFSIEEILNALVMHPFFRKDKTIISIGTSSTEPFAVGKVLESTLILMEKLIEMGYRNPVWIVTKAGIPDIAVNRLNKISKDIKKLIISICWANNPKDIEPVQNNRFENIEKLNLENISINWYLRPITKEWIQDIRKLDDMFEKVSAKYSQYIDCIIPGGLRWTEGIEYGMVEVRGLKMPSITKEDNKKTINQEEWEYIMTLAKKYFSNIPVFYHSSCGISYAVERSNICMTQIRKREECKNSRCPIEQQMRCAIKSSIDLDSIQNELDKKGYGMKIKELNLKDGTIVSEPQFTQFSPAIKQEVYKTIAVCIDEENER